MTQLVRQFHEKFGLPVLPAPAVPSHERRDLRWKLISEEYKEVVWAFVNVERAARDELANPEGITEKSALVNLAKELADLQYVVHGAALEFGLPFDRVFGTVHESNMSKLDRSGKPILREDGKILKGPLYYAAEQPLQQVLFP